MSRKNIKIKHTIQKDSIYNSVLVAKCVRHIMKDGKRSTAESIVYKAMDIAKKGLSEAKESPLEILTIAVDKVKPDVEVKSRRIGGAQLQVPTEVTPKRGLFKSLDWIISAAKKKTGKSMSERLAKEIMDSYNGVGEAIKAKENAHKMAEANRAFASYRF